MRRFAFIFAALLMLAPAAIQAEGGPSPAGEADADADETPDTSERKRYPPRDIEWASVAIGTGGFLVNGRLSAPTFVWKPFYWTTLHVDVGYGDARIPGGIVVVVGQSYGYPRLLQANEQHDLRVGAFVGFLSAINSPLSRDLHWGPYMKGWFGFALGPELTYLYHIKKHQSLTAGFRSAFAVAGDGDYYPFPYLAGQVGLAF